MATGSPNAVIATRLGIELATVKSHLSRAYRKLGVVNRVEATRYHIEHHGPAAAEPTPPTDRSASGPGAPSGTHAASGLEVEAQLRELRDEAERLRRRLEALRRPTA
jgi:hypothetical protein